MNNFQKALNVGILFDPRNVLPGVLCLPMLHVVFPCLSMKHVYLATILRLSLL